MNGSCLLQESIKHDHLDAFAVAMQHFINQVGELPGQWKSDVDSAFRRIPLAAEHRCYSGVAYKLHGVVHLSMHMAAPFGAVSSVYSWERVGHAISTIARRVLKLGCLRYVDDFFGIDREACLKHSMHCHARLVRAILGEDAIADRKLECGPGLAVLGIQMSVSWDGYRCPSPPRPDRSCCFP